MPEMIISLVSASRCTVKAGSSSVRRCRPEKMLVLVTLALGRPRRRKSLAEDYRIREIIRFGAIAQGIAGGPVSLSLATATMSPVTASLTGLYCSSLRGPESARSVSLASCRG